MYSPRFFRSTHAASGVVRTVIAMLCGILWLGSAAAQTTITDDFTGATSTNQWYFSGGACLTAGTGTSLSQPNSIPGCGTVFSSYYSLAIPLQRKPADAMMVGGYNNNQATTGALDPPTHGALRFTNGYSSNGQSNGTFQVGAIQSANTFNSSQGLQVTFKTVAYRGQGLGPGGDDSDGIGFQLLDGTISPSSSIYNGIGSNGGSLGYSCSNANTPFDGLVGGYLGLGIDEYGNFLNGYGLYPGYQGSNIPDKGGSIFADNSALGYGFKPNRIGLRGAGSVSWKYLHTTYPNYYPTSTLNTTGLQQTAVQTTCITGQVLDYSTGTNFGFMGYTVYNGGYNFIYVTSSAASIAVGQTVLGPNIPLGTTIVTGGGTGGIMGLYSPSQIPATGSAQNPVQFLAVPPPVSNPSPVLYDYAPIQNAYKELDSSVKLANETAQSRPDGVTVGNVFLYTIKITQNGLLSLSYTVNGGSVVKVITNQSITATNGPLPSLLRFGFSGSTGYIANIHEVLCFKAAPNLLSSSSAGTNQQQVGQLQTSTQAYFAYYDPNDYTGRLTAYGLTTSGGVLSLNSNATWDSQCVLTGVSNLATTTCPTTTFATPASAQSPTPGSSGSRVMLTWNDATSGGQGVAFEWPGSTSITTAITGLGTGTEANAIDAGNTSNASTELSYLRGDRSHEIQTSGATAANPYRARDGVLGDIVDSSPVFVGAPASPYTLAFSDRLYGSADATPENTLSNSNTPYANFVSSNQSRLNVLYVGANDGFLHGFRSGTQDASGNIVSTSTNDGLEVLAYMPGAVVGNVNNLNILAGALSNPQYSHAFFVDATPGTGDLFYKNAWHTWVVGGLGAGGADIYALDVTDPSTNGFSENNAANVVIGDWTPSTLSCVNTSAANAATCGNDLGNTYGTPLIRRLHNGSWGVIFGNGYGSSSGDAGIYVMTVNQSTAVTQFYYLSTSTGSTSSPNGIAFVTAADLDGDHITDYVYAGDLQGNLWRFDLTSCAPVLPASGTCSATTAWAVTPGPLFKTQTGQPITTAVVLASAKVAGTSPSLLVAFGTGQRTQFTSSSATSYAGATQSLYGVWDWNMGSSNIPTSWNGLSKSAPYAALTSAQVAVVGGTSAALTYQNLLNQPYVILGTEVNASSNASVSWASCTSVSPITCNGGQFGWYVNLPGSNGTGSSEQVVSNPITYQQGLFVNTTVPATSSGLSCTVSADTGNTYIINSLTGGTFTSTTNSSKVSAFVSNASSSTVGQALNMTGSLTIVNAKSAGGTYAIGQNLNPVTSTSTSSAIQPGQLLNFSLPSNIQAGRVTWTQVR